MKSIDWTPEQIERYGAEIKMLRNLGVRWCTIVLRYKDIEGYSITEAEVKRLLCLYQAKILKEEK